jgi:hypothetical protein
VSVSHVVKLNGNSYIVNEERVGGLSSGFWQPASDCSSDISTEYTPVLCEACTLQTGFKQQMA